MKSLYHPKLFSFMTFLILFKVKIFEYLLNSLAIIDQILTFAECLLWSALSLLL